MCCPNCLAFSDDVMITSRLRKLQRQCELYDTGYKIRVGTE